MKKGAPTRQPPKCLTTMGSFSLRVEKNATLRNDLSDGRLATRGKTMINIDENTEQQLHILEFLSSFSNPVNKRKRVKKSPFKILNAIYLFTKHNEQKGRQYHYPSFDTIKQMAKCGRRQVSEFINSPEIDLFCDVLRDTFTSHRYVLKDWVYQWFRLFWRSGMMKNIYTKWKWWHDDFVKRIHKWLIPQVHLGYSIRTIYERFLNRLSTTNSLKGNATNPLKGNTIKPSGISIKPLGIKSNIEGSLHPAIKELLNIERTLRDRFHLKEGDINRLINSFSLRRLKPACKLNELWIKRGMQIQSPIKVFQTCLNQSKEAA